MMRSKKKSKATSRQMETQPKTDGHSESSSKRETHSNAGLPQETRKISNNLNLYLEKEQKTNLKVSRRKELMKIRVEINKIESKKQIQKVNENEKDLVL